ncbi:MAG: amino acid decarboxylase [Deltaproteobacteria bacterium]|nr:MAG: amino acid decarboxylase [Deltaproteobacteria bacterium]
MSIDLSPEEFRRLAHIAVEVVCEHLAALEEGPARKPVPKPHRARLLEQPSPQTPQSPEELLKRIANEVMPYPMGNSNPRFLAWVNSPPAPLGIIADFMASALNPSVAGGDHAATYVEHAVLRWIREALGFSQSSGAILTSGGSMANLIGLATMRHTQTQRVDRTAGLQSLSAPLRVYASEQGHSCIEKALILLGFGTKNLRKVPTDSNFRMDLHALASMVADDREQGYHPACVAASAGTVNTGAIDPLDAIADFCKEQELWFHIDGAYGGFGVLAPSARPHYQGLERADSIAVDPHKWLYTPIECGCAVVADTEAMRSAFSLVPEYLRDDTEMPWFAEFGTQQTRGFRALKLWTLLQQMGLPGYGELLERDIQLNQLFAKELSHHPRFEVLSQSHLSITCFQHVPTALNGNRSALEEHNTQLLLRLQQEGHYYLTSTRLNNHYVLRTCIVNFRTQREDLLGLIERLDQLAGE